MKQNIYGTTIITINITIIITITITLDSDAYESVHYTFEVQVLCYYNDYVMHLSGNYIIY